MTKKENLTSVVRAIDKGQPTDKVCAQFSLFLSLVVTGIFFLFLSYQAQARNLPNNFQNSIGRIEDYENLMHNTALWRNQPDRRRILKKSEKQEHSGSGRILYKKITWGDSFRQHSHGVTSAFAVACPDGQHDIVVTNAHSFRSNENKPRTRQEKGEKLPLLTTDLSFQNSKGIIYPLKKARVTSGWRSSGSFKSTDSTDWAVVRLPNTFNETSTAPYEMAPVSSIKAQQCVKMVSWFHPITYKTPYQYIQTCEITSTYKVAGQKMIRHNCQTQEGSSGAALLDCETHDILGLHKGHHTKDEANPKQFKTDENYNIAIAFEGPVKRAVLDQCNK